MNRTVYVIMILFIVATLSCQKKETVFDLEKINARQKLDDVLKDIDDQIEDIKLDTLKLSDGELKENLTAREEELKALRDSVLTSIDQIGSVSEKEWDSFEAAMDSTVKRVEEAIELAQQHLFIWRQKQPSIPPTF